MLRGGYRGAASLSSGRGDLRAPTPLSIRGVDSRAGNRPVRIRAWALHGRRSPRAERRRRAGFHLKLPRARGPVTESTARELRPRPLPARRRAYRSQSTSRSRPRAPAPRDLRTVREVPRLTGPIAIVAASRRCRAAGGRPIARQRRPRAPSVGAHPNSDPSRGSHDAHAVPCRRRSWNPARPSCRSRAERVPSCEHWDATSTVHDGDPRCVARASVTISAPYPEPICRLVEVGVIGNCTGFSAA